MSVVEVAVVVGDRGSHCMCARAGFAEHNVAAAQPLPGFITHTHGIASSVGWKLQQSTLHQPVPLRWEPTAAC